MKSLFLFSILAFLCFDMVFSQSEQAYTVNTGIRAAYMGSIVHPGFKIGVEKPYKFTQIDKVRTKRTKTLYRERCFVYSFGMYHHKTFHTNFFAEAEWLMRKQKTSGMFYEFSTGLGLSRTFYAGTTYRIDEQGNTVRIPLAGNFYGLADISAGIGYNFDIKLNKPAKIYLKPGILVMFPYNKIVYPRPTVEFGMIYNFDGFWKSAPAHIHKTIDKTK